MKQMIYHLPWDIKPGRISSTGIRPLEMLNGFKEIGYDVATVMGVGSTRKNQIRDLMKRIEDGGKFDFLYSESSTAPTSFASGKCDAIRYWNMDLRFLRYCKKKRIPIGLFYRDIYWKFKHHVTETGLIKRHIFKTFHQYDIKQYNKLCEIVYLPSLQMSRYLDEVKIRMEPLPPGMKKMARGKRKGEITFCYVGGIGIHYNLHTVLSYFANSRSKLIFSTRKSDWEKVKDEYSGYFMNSNIRILHSSGNNTEHILECSDVGINLVGNDGYSDFAMPLKVFNYLQHGLPVVVTKGSAISDFVTSYGVGWAINNNLPEIANLFENVIIKEEEIMRKRTNISKMFNANTWIARARQVQHELTH